jgi:putative MATE family efflux protein
MAELVLGFAVSLLGLWMASRVSDAASGAFALANQVFGAFFLLFRIVNIGVSVVITQNLGAQNRIGADRIARAALGASTWLGLIVSVAIILGAGSLLQLVQAPEKVAALAYPYLQVLALALLFDAFNASMASVMRAHLHARDVMITILIMHALHLALCIPLMKGFGPIPAMGLPGFAVAMIISRVLGIGIHLFLWRWRLQLKPHLEDWWRLHAELLKPAVQIGLPGAAENVAYRIAMLASLTVVSGFGTQALATHSYAAQIMNLIVLFTVALGFSGEILVGHAIGAGDFKRAHRIVKKCLLWGLIISFLIALSAAASASHLLKLFTNEPRIIAGATALLWLTVILEPGRTFNVIVINALRATGDAKFPVYVGVASMLIVMAGGSWFFGSYLQWGLAGIWVAYAADEWVRGIIMLMRWYGLHWLPVARNSRRRALASKLNL